MTEFKEKLVCIAFICLVCVVYGIVKGILQLKKGQNQKELPKSQNGAAASTEGQSSADRTVTEEATEGRQNGGVTDEPANAGTAAASAGGHGNENENTSAQKPSNVDVTVNSDGSKTIDISHLGFFQACAKAFSEGLKGNDVTWNPDANKGHFTKGKEDNATNPDLKGNGTNPLEPEMRDSHNDEPKIKPPARKNKNTFFSSCIAAAKVGWQGKDFDQTEYARECSSPVAGYPMTKSEVPLAAHEKPFLRRYKKELRLLASSLDSDENVLAIFEGEVFDAMTLVVPLNLFVNDRWLVATTEKRIIAINGGNKTQIPRRNFDSVFIDASYSTATVSLYKKTNGELKLLSAKPLDEVFNFEQAVIKNLKK